KHNDLANVGRTARHHTFFEMLGNFSFGDYFKERAIELAWTMVTKELGLDPDRLLVTVYHEDEQAFNLWGSIAGLDERRILKIATSDNFWQMGDVGPCGPCSEIFYDHGDSIEGGPPGSADEDGDRFVEIWNLVFMQFEQHEDGTRTALPRPSIDTGMGLERIAAVLQGKHNNFDIDLFSDLTRSIADLTQDKTSDLSKDQRLVSYRVIADHLRSIGFLIAEGVMPANEGRGYVLRRIMRRAMRHAYMLGAEDPVLHRLTHALTDQMGSHYGELIRAQHLIEQTIHSEEQRFLTMLARGTQLLQAKLARLGEGQILDGESAFNLYDTYGFPLDLTEDIASHHGVRVDGAGFDAAMAAQRQRARKAWAGSGASATDKRWLELADAVGAGEFLGYQCQQSEGLITALLDTSHQRTNQLHSGAEGWLIANQTPFYGESGGQEGDQGTITTRDGGCFQVNDTVIIAGLILHKGHVKQDKPAVAVGDQALFAIDRQRRSRLCANHSATHLLHQALRRVLGGHVVQKGSLVSEGMLRFDFTHSGPLETGELALIEQSVNRHIRMNGAVTTQMMGSDAAIEQGAIALFGEKYPDEVRVLQMGEEPDGKAWSVELCGGTHVSRLGEIGGFRIIHQSGVAAGIRRIEAVTGEAMIEQAREQGEQLRTAAGLLR
ncbi:MAG: alanine--tRNA ligase, partial [Pseudomonadota bacterium]